MGAIARPFVLAWHFLTAIPLSRSAHEPAVTELAASMAWYPVVGLLIGSGLVGTDWVLGKLFSPEVVNALLILELVLLTRGLHQDGLADTVDGLAGGRTADERLQIMRDPRLGAIGGTGLCLSLLLRYAALLALPVDMRLPALLCMPAVGRWTMVTVAWVSPYARAEGGLATPFLTHLTWAHVAAATAMLSVALGLLFGVRDALVILLAGAAVVIGIWRSCHRWFGGITGDTLGATNEVTEILFLLLIPVLLLLP